MSRNIKLTLEYDGTRFEGWQVQKKNQRTVQGEIEKALKKIFKEEIRLIGSGRTDSGVHALGQAASLKTRSRIPAAQIKRALNANLPADIAVVDAEEVGPRFHAQYSVRSKTYRYTILNRAVRSTQGRHFCLLFPYKLNLRLMREEAQALIGRHDFKSFQAANPAHDEKATTVRIVKHVEIIKRGDFIFIDIEADGFLYKMVRNIVGTLLEIGSGRLPQGSIKVILKKRNRLFAGDTAKPHGLTLLGVKY
ncbi:MAG: tRNA pseudouridine(38-40) synthase TruA [Omnitrophica WOR_2 bacterium RIFCSPHIGHO2_02_FULL_50_17]|nr:MAG: tRNA pseudouridine(38-40) synthase TruA [Omnitrophica WOR_2 bacterium RIFCSPHIGHO2_02_FULL_50_17]